VTTRRHRYPEIERCPGLDRATFVREYLSQNRPVVIPSDSAAWCARWSPAAIRARFGHCEIEVEETREIYVGDRALVRRPLGSMLDGVLADDTRERWKGLEFLAKVPGMRAELAASPPPFDALMPEGMHAPRSTLWIAPRKTMSSLHHDGNFDNLNMQVSGKKLFLLVAPPKHDALYRYGSAESPINPFVPDLRRFPRFSEARPVEATLGPGDTLLVPKYWWHCVYALEPSVNLATCFSWRGELSPRRVLEGAPLLHRSLTVLSAEMKRRGLRRLADASRRVWYATYRSLVARGEPHPPRHLAHQ
jgi:hypothetical protein